MDTIGLLAAWVGIVCFFFAILISIAAYVFTPLLQRWWAKTSRKRTEKRLQVLTRLLDNYNTAPDNRYIADLVSMYGSMILNLIAATGLIILSVTILDLGPALLASILPFDIDSKILTRTTGISTMLLCYFFVFRISYLGARIRQKVASVKSENVERVAKEIARLRTRLRPAQ